MMLIGVLVGLALGLTSRTEPTGIVARVEAPKHPFSMGSPVVLAFELENFSPRPYRLNWRLPDEQSRRDEFEIVVLDKSGRRLEERPPPPITRPTNESQLIDLQPGQRCRTQIDIGRYVQLERGEFAVQIGRSGLLDRPVAKAGRFSGGGLLWAKPVTVLIDGP